MEFQLICAQITALNSLPTVSRVGWKPKALDLCSLSLAALGRIVHSRSSLERTEVDALGYKCESFNGRFRDECLNLEWFDSLKEAQVVIEAWRDHYNQERPHSALNYLASRQFIQHWQQEQDLLRQSA